MLSLTKMLTGDTYYGDELRYSEQSKNQRDGVSEGRGPVAGSLELYADVRSQMPALLFQLGEQEI